MCQVRDLSESETALCDTSFRFVEFRGKRGGGVRMVGDNDRCHHVMICMETEDVSGLDWARIPPRPGHLPDGDFKKHFLCDPPNEE